MEVEDKGAVTQVLRERIDCLQRKIVEIQAIQQRSDAEFAHYRELHKLYRRVLEAEELGPRHEPSISVETEGLDLGHQPRLFVEAEGNPGIDSTVVCGKPTTVADAVRRILSEHPGERLHRSEIADLVSARYPEIVNKARDFEGAVGDALQVGKEKGLWKWIRSGVYRYR